MKGLLAHAAAASLLGLAFAAQAQSGTERSLGAVTVTAAAQRDPVEKSYVRMLNGMALFERERAKQPGAPGAHLRFKLLQRRSADSLENVELHVLGKTVDMAVPIAADRTFTLERNQRALDEDAAVVLDRKARTATWRAEIRSPGVPPGMRRLGDMRLECEVGLEAGLVSEVRSLLDQIGNALSRPAYCKRNPTRYFFFAERPLFKVTLAAGPRREVLPIGELYAGLADDPGMAEDMPFCDCEALVDRTYFLPLGDSSWPDDTLVEFEYMDGPP